MSAVLRDRFEIAKRGAELGGSMTGTARVVASTSRNAAFPRILSRIQQVRKIARHVSCPHSSDTRSSGRRIPDRRERSSHPYVPNGSG